ncbi:MAG: hypothetical protein GY795_26725 [Desulfobacterales bacterium]|nr:hypothetical protein [Desulfobacterales bacterium]
MASKISIQNIIDSALRGIAKAQKNYEEWTGGEWLWTAPEYLLTTSVASEIAKIKGATKYLTLENNTYQALEDAGATGKGKLHSDLRANGKVDILLWWANSTPRAVIEVKNQVSNIKDCQADIKRIKQLLKRKSNVSSFQFGLFAFYTSSRDRQEFTAEERLEKRLQNIYEQSTELIGDDLTLTIHKKKIQVQDDSAWVSAVLLIR